MKRVLVGFVVSAIVVGAGSAMAAPDRTQATDLKGSEEVPGPGDPDASGFATLQLGNPGSHEICYDLHWENISGENHDASDDAVTAAHIHEAGPGVAAPPAVPLFVDQHLPTSSSMSGCVSATPKTIAQINAHPEDYYVNIHSGEYPSGAIRGQLGDDPGSNPENPPSLDQG